MLTEITNFTCGSTTIKEYITASHLLQNSITMEK